MRNYNSAWILLLLYILKCFWVKIRICSKIRTSLQKKSEQKTPQLPIYRLLRVNPTRHRLWLPRPPPSPPPPNLPKPAVQNPLKSGTCNCAPCITCNHRRWYSIVNSSLWLGIFTLSTLYCVQKIALKPRNHSPNVIKIS